MPRTLAFVYSPTCGHSRRMDSIVDHFLRLHRGALRVAKVDISERPDLAERLGVTSVPSLVLLDGPLVLERIEGRCTLPAIKARFEHLLETPPPAVLSYDIASAC